MSRSLTRIYSSNGLRQDAHVLLDFLIPPSTLLSPCLVRDPSRHFATSPSAHSLKRKNRNRGVSALRRTGLRQSLSVSKEPLPVPVLEADRKAKIEVDENHGLWGFFNKNKTPLNTPVEDHSYGRPWSTEELRHKSWNDLHRLWWACCKERNRIATSNAERKRIQATYGDFEAKERDTAVVKSQVAIKQVLLQRQYGWEDARKIIAFDPRFSWPDGDIQFQPSATDGAENESLQDSPETEEQGQIKL